MNLMERLEALITKQRDERGDMMTLGQADPEIIEAAALIRIYEEALEKIAAGNFNCSPHQHGMAMQAVAESALKAKASQ